MGFRFFARENARRLGLKGYVRNREDGSVELEAFGERKTLEAFLEILQQDKGFARVERVEKEFTGKSCESNEFSARF